MTLPGIAGLALTIGMAVDANVLINERIREELRAGRALRAAVEAGYDKAFSAIVDGHVTTFISGLILAQYGTGPVKGFAVTLIIGIIASLFTGVFCTRLVFDWWVRGAKVKASERGSGVLSMEFFKPGKVYDFMGVRKYWIALSVLLALGRCCSSSTPARTTAPTSRAAPRSRSRSRSPSTAGEIRARGHEERRILRAGRRPGHGRRAPEPLPDPRPGDQHGRRGDEGGAAQGALPRRRG